MQVEVVSPERIIYSGEAEMVVCRTVGGGDIAFKARHEPFIGVLKISKAKLIAEDESAEVFAIHSGFVQMTGDKVTILSDVSEHSDDIDLPRAEASLAKAEAAVAADADDLDAIAALERANVRIRVATGAE